MNSQRTRAIIAGLALIGLGLGIWYLKDQEVGGGYVLILVGGIFTSAYFFTRNYGYLVPGCILLGLGLPVVMGEIGFFSLDTVIFLGAGFIAIYLIQLIYERKAMWWPLIPGTILILAGMDRFDDVFRMLSQNWPLILVVVGVLIIIGAIFRKPGGQAG